MVNLKIDGQEIKCKEERTILEVAKDAGIDIPTLCYHNEISPYGACRLCTVEIIRGDAVRLQASCCAPVEEGIKVLTNSERIINGRKMMIELLLSRCPKIKKLQELAEEYGIDKLRFSPREENCILCGLCVRACAEIVGRSAVGFSARGIKRKVSIPYEEEISLNCVACGACTYICPTGAIQMESKTLQRFRTFDGEQRKCRYMMMGVVDYKLCSKNYECYHCEIDQRMEETYGMHPAFAVKLAEQKKLQKIGEFYLDPNLYYFQGHTWVKMLNGRVRIGIDDFAQRILGRNLIVKLPSRDLHIKKKDFAFEVIVSDKKAEILAPLSGKITDVNFDIEINPHLVKREPFGRGWLFDMEPDDLSSDIKGLLKKFDAVNWLRNDAVRLDNLTMPKYSSIIADGGYILADLPGILNEEEWKTLTKEFFLT